MLNATKLPSSDANKFRLFTIKNHLFSLVVEFAKYKFIAYIFSGNVFDLEIIILNIEDLKWAL